MKRVLPSLGALATALVTVGCGFSGGGVTGNDQLKPTFENYVHFDTTRYVNLRTPAGSKGAAEPALTWEQVIGEPFTDVNENGVFDPGIDEFIISAGPDNQDLNHNGKYDGPDDPWIPLTPFDDINGDAVFQSVADWTSRSYSPGLPFADLNGNGIYDSTLEFKHQMARCLLRNLSGDQYSYAYFKQDSAYVFVSDSNRVYYYPPYPIPGEWRIGIFSFRITTGGLWFNSYGSEFLVQKKGDIEPVTAEETVINQTWWPDTKKFSVRKTLRVNQELEIGDITYRNLVHIRFDDAERLLYNDSLVEEAHYYEMYFSSTHGLLALDYWERFAGGAYYFDARPDVIPIPMMR